MNTIDVLRVLTNHGFKLIKRGDKVNQENILKMARWSKEHETHLKDLYEAFQKDVGDNTTSFVEFCAYMYFECKH